MTLLLLERVQYCLNCFISLTIFNLEFLIQPVLLDYQEIVAVLAEDALQLVNDYGYDLYDAVLETVDGSEYAIYSYYHEDILRYSENREAALDIYGGDYIGKMLIDEGIGSLNSLLACWALVRDVMDYLG